MKQFSIIMAVLGGALAGATVGLLFAPEKGADMRAKIVDLLREKGVKLRGDKMDELAAKIADEINGVEKWCQHHGVLGVMKCDQSH